MAVTSAISEFSFAVKHTLSCLGMDDLVLQQEQVDAMQYVYEGKDVFIMAPYWIWQVYHLPDTSLPL